jgi:putative N-acetylmannosamine-6-phosphate epimerase
VNNEPDVVASGSVDRPRRALKLIAVAVSALVVAAFLGVNVDRAQRHRESVALLASTVDGRATAQHAEAVVESTRAYTMPLLDSAQLDVRAGLAQLIANSASQGAVAVRVARAKVAAVRVVPWHGATKKAKDDDERYLDAWSAYLDAVARGDVLAPPD